MDGRLQTRFAVAAAVVLVCLVQLGESGECCKAHYSIVAGDASNEQKWCDNYCCFNVLKYDCCDNILLQAPADMRMDFCMDWFDAYWYVPVLIVLAILGAIITCCVCCCSACCRNHTSGAVLVPPQPQSMLVVTHQAHPNDQSSSHANPFNTGYDQ